MLPQSTFCRIRPVCQSFKRTFKPIVIKDVYKMTNFKLKNISEDEKSTILKMINETTEENQLEPYFSKARASKIFKFVSENGPLQAVEQLVDVKGITGSVLEKACLVMLNPDVSSKKKGKNVNQKRTLPSIPKDYQELESIDVVGLKYDLRCFAFSHMKDQNLMFWDVCEPALTTQSAFDHHNLVASSQYLIDQLPEAQFYVYEEIPRLLQRDPNLQIKIKLAILEASLCATLKAKFPQSSIFSLRHNALASDYDFYVSGNQATVSENITKLVPDGFQFSEGQWNRLLQLGQIHRERLSTSLLISLSFQNALKMMK